MALVGLKWPAIGGPVGLGGLLAGPQGICENHIDSSNCRVYQCLYITSPPKWNPMSSPPLKCRTIRNVNGISPVWRGALLVRRGAV